MSDADSPSAVATAIVDASRYMTLATADEGGTPWATPVWFAHVGYRELFWVSAHDAGHSASIRVRPEVGIVLFDTGALPGTGQGVYLAARAAEVAERELDRGIDVFSHTSVAQGMRAWTRADVVAPARRRLYRAVVLEAFLNNHRDVRTPVALP